jgi:hypothetical protein
MFVRVRRGLLLGSSVISLIAGSAEAQTQLPEIVVTTPSPIVRRALNPALRRTNCR